MNSFVPEASSFQSQNFLDTGVNNNSANDNNNLMMSMENYNYGFGSNATNLEYSILSNMLGSPLADPTNVINSSPVQTSADVLNNIWSQPSPVVENVTTPLSIIRGEPSYLSSPTHLVTTPTSSYINSNNNNNNTTTVNNNNTNTNTNHNNGVVNNNNNTNNNTNNNSSNNISSKRPVPSISSSTIGTSQITPSGVSTLSAFGDGAVVAKVASPVTASVGPAVRRRNQIITPEMAYASATKPFSYAEGYHYLINYVKSRMGREDLMRISRALALFRPSVLASMMNLTEDDLIFTEKCLQRTLLEYEKLISYSGTPTVVWRRTGEITLVGKEFSLLTQWSRDTLLGKKTYIYELMSNPSAVEYWEKYALHAFDNTDSAVYSTCILMSPTKRVVPCTFCFTIKRDIFDLPSVIVGNFLPILS
ncbi:uncharacterized protein EV154DRAFT_269320 [Mucor mucedo]|uniref:uncharacterized protein n=1 Tax=Mucor mucedo TaxID=29922 RepID=UPI002220AE2C|nr:uncharacterized protein EV154DRAFT_269320 [Mucor mucedo]KAI7889766.1 hypothetical protein EV154DRAFT_269320 [Mucor mucedo]